MKILKFSLMVAVVIGAVVLIGGNLGAQVVSTSQGNIYPNNVAVVQPLNNAAPIVINQPQKVVIKPFPFFDPLFHPFFHPFFNNNLFDNNFFDPFSGVSSSPLLIP